MNQTLCLLRHAKAEPWSHGINDFERVLSQRGRDHMSLLADWMRENLVLPEQILCSSSHRTRETLSPLVASWPTLAAEVSFLDDIYDATTGMLHALAEQSFQQSAVTLMIGHNPGFEYLALALMRDIDARGIKKMATGTLAVIDFPEGYSRDCGQGVLRHWLRRKDLLAD